MVMIRCLSEPIGVSGFVTVLHPVNIMDLQHFGEIPINPKTYFKHQAGSKVNLIRRNHFKAFSSNASQTQCKASSATSNMNDEIHTHQMYSKCCMQLQVVSFNMP